MNSAPQSLILQAIDALKIGERRRACALLTEELRIGPASGDRWRSVVMLAAQIGEIDVALEASRRAASTAPQTIERLLNYWGDLAKYGRSAEAIAIVEGLPVSVRDHPAILHFRGVIAGENGDFEQAEKLYRRALAKAPMAPQTWFALTMIKKFSAGDPDLAAMERLVGQFDRTDPAIQARFLYGLGKAWDDIGEVERAYGYYAQGAALRRQAERHDAVALERQADGLIRDFTPEAVKRLTPSLASEQRSIFVNGLPRSGTTLVEQILTSHSKVVDGGEVNLLHPALIPTVDYSFSGALAYQGREAGNSDPWGDIARDYRRLIDMRFRFPGLVVDKTLGQSVLMGLLLHSQPQAKILWMRRNPDDVALSCFKTFFTATTPWSWSFADIGRHFRVEDRLFEHWTRQFGDRILVVPYEELAQHPATWIPKILTHVGLDEEPQVHRFHETRRGVRTASVQQVRSPISTNRIGLAERYAQQMKPFRDAYYG